MKFSGAFFLIIFLFSCTASTSDSTNEENGVDNEENIADNDDPQALTLADLQFTDLDNNTFSGEKYVGKPVFVHFWATWCRPCIVEMPTIEDVMTEFDDITYVFPSDEKIKDIRKFKNSREFPFNYVQLKSGFQHVGVSTLPTTYLFDKEGKLQGAIVGAQDWTSEEANTLLKDFAGR